MSQPVGTTVANYQLYSMNEDCSVDEYHPTNLAVVSESASLIVTIFAAFILLDFSKKKTTNRYMFAKNEDKIVCK